MKKCTITNLGRNTLKDGRSVILFFDEAGFGVNGKALFYKSKNRRVYVTKEEAETPFNDSVGQLPLLDIPPNWKIQQMEAPISTVGELMDVLKNYSRDLPLLLKHNELGLTRIKKADLQKVKPIDYGGGSIGEFEEAGIGDSEAFSCLIIKR